MLRTLNKFKSTLQHFNAFYFVLSITNAKQLICLALLSIYESEIQFFAYKTPADMQMRYFFLFSNVCLSYLNYNNIVVVVDVVVIASQFNS